MVDLGFIVMNQALTSEENCSEGRKQLYSQQCNIKGSYHPPPFPFQAITSFHHQ